MQLARAAARLMAAALRGSPVAFGAAFGTGFGAGFATATGVMFLDDDVQRLEILERLERHVDLLEAAARAAEARARRRGADVPPRRRRWPPRRRGRPAVACAPPAPRPAAAARRRQRRRWKRALALAGARPAVVLGRRPLRVAGRVPRRVPRARAPLPPGQVGVRRDGRGVRGDQRRVYRGNSRGAPTSCGPSVVGLFVTRI